MEEITITGLISKIHGRYVVTADDGSEYEISAIRPWESVAADYDTGKFTSSLGKRMQVSGMTDGSTIWGASILELSEEGK